MAKKDTLPFPLLQTRDSTYSHLDNLVGQEYEQLDGKVYRLVRANGAVTSPGGRSFSCSTPTSTGAARWDVQLSDLAGAINLQRSAGVAPAGMDNITDNDYFFVQIAGLVESAVKGNDGTNTINPGTRDFVSIDDDTDLGKFKGTTTSSGIVTVSIIGVTTETTEVSATDATFDFHILGKLGG